MRSCFTAETLAISGIVATDGEIDSACLPLWEALQHLHGVEVIAACSGHGTQPLRIWWTAENMGTLRRVLVPWHSILTSGGWECIVQASCACCPVRCELRSTHPVDLAEHDARILADLLAPVMETMPL